MSQAREVVNATCNNGWGGTTIFIALINTWFQPGEGDPGKEPSGFDRFSPSRKPLKRFQVKSWLKFVATREPVLKGGADWRSAVSPVGNRRAWLLLKPEHPTFIAQP
jgi:hypothetical protein